MRILFIALRAAGAVAIVAAIVGQLLTTSGYWDSRGLTDHSVLFLNFFSYFTIDSNAFSVVVLGVGVAVLLRGTPESLLFGVVRGCVTTYMAITGIVYNTLLTGIDVSEGLVLPWSNTILHIVGPLLLVADWLLAPGRTRLGWRHLGVIVAFPLVWSVYTLLRGPTAPDPLSGKSSWYPYPFLNPSLSSAGYGSVAVYVIGIAIAFAAVGAGVIWVSRRRTGWPMPAAA